MLNRQVLLSRHVLLTVMLLLSAALAAAVWIVAFSRTSALLEVVRAEDRAAVNAAPAVALLASIPICGSIREHCDGSDRPA